MDIYEAIFHRRSVRNYSEKELSPSMLKKIDRYTKDLDRLYDIESDVKIVKDGSRVQDIMSGIIGNYGKIRAPHYIVVTSEDKDRYLENIGFSLEPTVLELTSAGIGTCWIGGHVPKDKLEDLMEVKPGHTAEILIAFGRAEDHTHRDKEEAKRKSVYDITIGDQNGHEKLIEAARFAPSAVNSQPWRFLIKDDLIHAYSVKRSRITKLVTKNLHLMNRIDVGIALSHMKIAAKKHDKNITFKKLNAPTQRKMKYITSAEINTN